MCTTTDVVVISSSPDQIRSCSLANPKCGAEKAFVLSPVSSSPSSLPSSSDLFQPPTRSRFFKPGGGNEGSSRTAREESETGTKQNDLAASRKKAAVRGGRQKRTKEQPPNESQTLFDNPEPPIPKHNGCTSKKGTGSRKKRIDAASKCTKSGSKKITGKVTKPGITETTKFENKTKIVTSDVSPGKSPANKLELEKDGLQIEVAMKRRLDWTPTKDTGKQAVALDDTGDNKTRFGELLSEYGFLKAAAVSQTDSKLSDGAPTKCRRLELVDTHNPSTSKRTSPDADSDRSNVRSTRSSRAPAAEGKSKKRSRKITTLTGRVTALYTKDCTDHLDAANTMIRASEDVSSKLLSKSLDLDSCVLAPGDAVDYLQDQDLIFGTCSQLEREDSPTMLRDMQKEICASKNSMIENRKPSSTTRAGSGLYSHTTVSRFQTQRDLWSVAARDMDGSLAEIEVLDMVDITDVSELPPKPNGELPDRSEKNDEDTVSQGESSRPIEITDDFGVEVDVRMEYLATSETKPEETAYAASEIRPMPRFADWKDSDLSRQVRLYGFKPMKNRRKMIEVLERCWKAQHSSTRTGVQYAPGKPDDGSTGKAGTIGSQMNKQSSKMDAAEKMRRESACLKEKAKSSTALEDKLSHATDRSSQMLTKSSFAHMEEIEDSEDEVIPSPSQLQSLYKRHISESRSSHPLPVSDTPSTPSSRTRTNADSDTKPSPSDSATESSLPDLASQITKAVRLQPRSFSVDCKRPSWHEKILMYDPIILEDFATWLNIEGLGLVHEDREVSAEFVRQWCESNGICCGFRKNSRRSER